jgi:SET domain-containing protein
MEKGKEKILGLLGNTYCRLRPSPIEGIGVFAIKDIPKNTNPFLGIRKQKWFKISMAELAGLDGEILKMIDDFFEIKKAGTVLLPECGINGMDISFFLNNSKKPNLRILTDGVNFVSSRKIKKGEELTVSYATFDEKYKNL